MARRPLTDEQKATRRDQIIDAALTLYRRLPLHRITVEHIAREAGVAKGTFFLSFATREELFVTVLTERYDRFFAAMKAALESVKPGDRAAVIRIIVATYESEPVLRCLSGILHAVLETNVAEAPILRFKKLLLDNVLLLGGVLERKLPYLQPWDGTTLLLQTYALTVGLQNMAEPAEAVRSIIEQHGLHPIAPDFGSYLADTLDLLLRGYEARSGDTPVIN